MGEISRWTRERVRGGVNAACCYLEREDFLNCTAWGRVKGEHGKEAPTFRSDGRGWRFHSIRREQTIRD
jgi:hypothetical protein